MEPYIIHAHVGDNPPKAELYYGLNVLDGLALLPDNSVNMVACSPPYWGLRNYGVELQVWGGDPACEHEWGLGIQTKGQSGGTGRRTALKRRKRSTSVSRGCAWRRCATSRWLSSYPQSRCRSYPQNECICSRIKQKHAKTPCFTSHNGCSIKYTLWI